VCGAAKATTAQSGTVGAMVDCLAQAGGVFAYAKTVRHKCDNRGKRFWHVWFNLDKKTQLRL